MTQPLCYSCRHFRQHQPLTSLKPGVCNWRPAAVPPWLELWLVGADLYGPRREIWSRGNIITDCSVYDAAAESGAEA
jgi:hypothetical protein